jgi:hypothetical protein
MVWLTIDRSTKATREMTMRCDAALFGIALYIAHPMR